MLTEVSRPLACGTHARGGVGIHHFRCCVISILLVYCCLFLQILELSEALIGLIVGGVGKGIWSFQKQSITQLIFVS